METHEPDAATEKPPILIGTWGFDVDAWSPAFYPEELPRDWRFAYYSNLLRSVLLPAADLAQRSHAQLVEWAGDADAEFRLVIELPVETVDSALRGDSTRLEDCRELIVPLAAQTAAFMLSTTALCDASDDSIARLLRQLGDVPVCMGDAVLPDGCAARLARFGIGTCWDTAQQPAPNPGGRLLLVRTGLDTPAQQRTVLEAIAAWQQGRSPAAVFFDHPAKAQQARLLADLMNL